MTASEPFIMIDGERIDAAAVRAMKQPLAGLHYLAVGATSGLGGVFAAKARVLGAKVSVLALGPKRGEDHYVCDVTSDDWRGIVHALPNIHGVAFFQRYRGNGEVWNGEIETQLTATTEMIDFLVKWQASSSIVITASASASLVTTGMSPGYHVAKAGLMQLARYYAVLLGPQGIRVNAVCPGSFIKPENAERLAAGTPERRRLASASPLGRMGTADEVAEAVLWLLSDKASFVTGASLVVDGGVGLRWQEDLVL
jgi:hypothetical protein